MKLNIFWFRRDLRWHDNIALNVAIAHAKKNNLKILPLFIFDEDILKHLSNKNPRKDARVSFIYETLVRLDKEAKITIYHGQPYQVWQDILKTYPNKIDSVFCNHDYEPQAIARDEKIKQLLSEQGIEFQSFKDQVIFEKEEILKTDGTPYTIFTPYKNRWLKAFFAHKENLLNPIPSIKFEEINSDIFFTANQKEVSHSKDHKLHSPFPSLSELGFQESNIKVPPFELGPVDHYHKTRDFPKLQNSASTTGLGPYLRFGLVSVRQIIKTLDLNLEAHQVFLSELIWREFFMHILFHFPRVVNTNFKRKYDQVVWLNREEDFTKWCQGMTGYPLVDAGMRQLNLTGTISNRVRMITAGFLCKHLLIDWQWGERYFAERLLDYELSANNGNWQWAAGTGCDAAPYFRVFNPQTQLEKFDSNRTYVKEYLPDFNTPDYPAPMIDHAFARTRALATYKVGLSN